MNSIAQQQHSQHFVARGPAAQVGQQEVNTSSSSSWSSFLSPLACLVMNEQANIARTRGKHYKSSAENQMDRRQQDDGILKQGNRCVSLSSRSATKTIMAHAKRHCDTHNSTSTSTSRRRCCCARPISWPLVVCVLAACLFNLFALCDGLLFQSPHSPSSSFGATVGQQLKRQLTNLSSWRYHQATKRTLAVQNNNTILARHIANGETPAKKQQNVDEQEEARAAHWSLPNRPSLFSIIRFPNEECFDSSNQSGTCYTAFECKLLGGQPSSPCAAGFGSCCIVSRTCHVTTREKVVYFKNPSYPSTDSDEKFCDLTIEISDINVCQLRLDFLDFQLDPPTSGACQDDYMEISATGMPPQTVPRLCGLNRNQHLYINLPQDLRERSASIVFYTDPVGDHRWQVKVTQIDCNHYRPYVDWTKRHYAKFASSPLWNAHPNLATTPIRLTNLATGSKYSTTFASGFQTMSQTASALAYELLKPQYTPRAPMGCLQYFTQSSGIIESFNFGQYLNNMDYSICIQRQPDTCRIVFTSSDYDWSLNGVGIAGSSSGVGDQDCARDYLLVPGASRTGDGFTYDRYCGGRLNYYRGQSLSAPIVVKTSGPIVLRFHSDAHFETINNGGFRLQYDQSAQDCIYHTAEEAGSLASQQLLASTLADSRPLSGPFVQDAPVMYAAQQQQPSEGLTSTQQLVHVDMHATDHQDSSQQQQQHIDRTHRPTNVSSHNYNSLLASVAGEQIKRSDSDATNGTRRAPNLLLLADLNKAFQLISSRSARHNWSSN